MTFMGASLAVYLPWAERTAEQKSGAALCLCAMAYDNQGDQQVAEDASDEVKRDNLSYEKAVEYYRRALLYENGRGVERDLDAAEPRRVKHH